MSPHRLDAAQRAARAAQWRFCCTARTQHNSKLHRNGHRDRNRNKQINARRPLVTKRPKGAKINPLPRPPLALLRTNRTSTKRSDAHETVRAALDANVCSQCEVVVDSAAKSLRPLQSELEITKLINVPVHCARPSAGVTNVTSADAALILFPLATVIKLIILAARRRTLRTPAAASNSYRGSRCRRRWR